MKYTFGLSGSSLIHEVSH